jgi:hypothetical protein
MQCYILQAQTLQLGYVSFVTSTEINSVLIYELVIEGQYDKIFSRMPQQTLLNLCSAQNRYVSVPVHV